MKWDTYTLQARQKPALLVALPIGLLVAVWFPDKVVGWGILASILTTFGFTALLAQVGRDQGKAKEPSLFALWGGKPTTRHLRHATSGLDWITLTRCHAKLGAIVGIPAPTKQEEQTDPATADEVYEAYTKYLREATRDRFSLVFAENVNYGFRRNLWGMKPAAVVLCIVGLVGSIGAVVYHSLTGFPGLAAGAIGLNLVLLALWAMRVNPAWVRVAGDAYAERLLCACDNLPEPKAATATQPSPSTA